MGSGHGQCAELHTLAGAGLREGRVTAPVEVDGGRNRTLGGGWWKGRSRTEASAEGVDGGEEGAGGDWRASVETAVRSSVAWGTAV